MTVYDCDDANYLPCISHASWSLTGVQLLVSFCVWILVWGAVKLYSPVWHSRPGGPPQWALLHFGSPEEPPAKIELNAYLRLAQLCASTTIVITWIIKSYEHDVTPGIYAVEVLCCVVFAIHHFYALVNSGFNAAYVIGLEGFIDAFTIPPLLMQGFGGSWLTLAYLRSYRMKTAFQRLVATGLLDDYINELGSALIVKFAEFLVVLTWIGCTTFLLEGLGDVAGFADRFVQTDMGGISFFQCCYYTMVVMSTVGFGDYSPQTVFSRFFVFFAIVGGILFFSVATGDIMEVSETLKSGLGKYRSAKKQGVHGYRGHILVLGGGVSARTKDACEQFLMALCRDESTPEVVLMGHHLCQAVKDMCSEAWAAKFGVQLFQGSSLSKGDLERVRIQETSMIFIIADFNAADSLAEDQNNILTAAAVQKYYPQLQYRLMTVEVQNLELCAHVGLNMFNCYAIEGLKAAILATSLKCPGFPTMVLNLGLPDLPDPKPHAEQELSPWLTEYLAASRLEPYGFLPNPKFIGKAFGEVARLMAKEGVALLAAQVEGLLRLNPQEHVLNDRTVLFAMAEDQQELNRVALNLDASVKTWLPTFGSNRKLHSTDEAKAGQALKLNQGAFSGGASSSFKDSISEPSPTSAHHHGGGALVAMKGGRAHGIAVNTQKIRKLTSVSKLTARRPRRESHVQRLNESMLADISAAQAESEGKRSPLEPPAELVKEGGHAVLCLLYTDSAAGPGLYAQVEVILSNLRHTVETPVIILGPDPGDAERKLVERFREKYKVSDTPNVFLVEGNPLDPASLRRAGVPTAEHFLCIAPSGGVSNSETEDRSNLLMQGVLDNLLRKWEHTDLCPVYDWCTTDSFGMMPEPPSPYTETATDPLPNLSADDKAFMGDVPRCHYRFASGRVLPKPLIAGVYSMAYYTPGVLELFEALIDPSKTDQEASAWPVPVPGNFVGKPYAAFAESLLESGGVPIGILRADGGPLPYVVAATPANKEITLSLGDAAYVLGSMEWASEHINFTATGLTQPSLSAPSAGESGGVAMVSNPLSSVVASGTVHGVEPSPFGAGGEGEDGL